MAWVILFLDVLKVINCSYLFRCGQDRVCVIKAIVMYVAPAGTRVQTRPALKPVSGLSIQGQKSSRCPRPEVHKHSDSVNT